MDYSLKKNKNRNMEIEISNGILKEIDQDHSLKKWSPILDSLDFYDENVKKFASLYAEIFTAKKNEPSIIMNEKNLLIIDLLTLSKLDSDNKTIEYSINPEIVKDYIIPIFLENDGEVDSSSEEYMRNITDAVSDMINQKIIMSEKIYINTPISDIVVSEEGKLIKILVYTKFGTV